jgi:hypothetical protein
MSELIVNEGTKREEYPCGQCGYMYDVRGQCGCSLLTIPVIKKATPVPKVARGFKGLKGTTIGTVIADAVNQVTLIAKDGRSYFVIDVEVVNGIPILKCKKHKVIKYKRPVTSMRKIINKFGDQQ